MTMYIFSIKRTIAIISFIVLVTPVFALAQTTGAVAGISGGTALNWAGYVSDTGTYTSVSGSWTVPSVARITENGADATWVGIGGVLSHDLIQVGTEAVPNSSGGTNYQAWYELLPAGAVVVPLSVDAGDSISAVITRQSDANATDTLWLITITDTTTGKSYSTTVRYASTLSSAEWVEEMPAGVGTQISLDNFGTVAFSDAMTTDDGTNVSIAGSNAQSLTMANIEDQALAVPSVLGPDGSSFSVTRTDAASSAIGIAGMSGRTFVTSSSSATRAIGYGNYGYSTGTSTSITPAIAVRYGLHPHYRVMRAYTYSPQGDNSIIRLVINGFSY